jgi:hypothetical protein
MENVLHEGPNLTVLRGELGFHCPITEPSSRSFGRCWGRTAAALWKTHRPDSGLGYFAEVPGFLLKNERKIYLI